LWVEKVAVCVFWVLKIKINKKAVQFPQKKREKITWKKKLVCFLLG